MNFKITFNPTIDYYKEAYSELIKSNKLKRLEPVFSIFMILLGIGLWYFDKNKSLELFSILFCGLGVYEFIKVYTSRGKWINDRIRSGIIGQEIQLQFTDDLIIHDGPFQNGNMECIQNNKANRERIDIKTKNRNRYLFI